MTTNSSDYQERMDRMYERQDASAERERVGDLTERELPEPRTLPAVAPVFSFERLHDGEGWYWRATHVASGVTREFGEFSDVEIYLWCEAMKGLKVEA